MIAWECIFITDQAYRAEIIRMVLQDNNIEAVVVNKKDSAYIQIGHVEVHVRSEDVILARIILEREKL
jgi:hypothetical protein